MAKDTMIQDLNPLNAHIYFEGFMYVGGEKHLQNPTFFAPYFTNECAADPALPDVIQAGIAYYSPVIVAHSRSEVKAQDLISPNALLERFAPGDTHSDRWLRGLEEICERRRREKWPNDTERPLYFLDAPVPLGHIIRKSGWMAMIPQGYGTAFDRLSTADCIMELTVRCPH